MQCAIRLGYPIKKNNPSYEKHGSTHFTTVHSPLGTRKPGGLTSKPKMVVLVRNFAKNL